MTVSTETRPNVKLGWRIALIALAVVIVIAALGTFAILHLRSAANLAPLHLGPGTSDQAVLGYKANKQETGAYTHEQVLTPANVKSSSFGLVAAYRLDGTVNAQPLYDPGVTIRGHKYNVVYVVSGHDTVYAFNADSPAKAPPLWKVSLLAPGETPVPLKDVYGQPNSTSISGLFGIMSTPTIDPATGDMYLVSSAMGPGNKAVQKLHAVNIATGADVSSTVITASVSGTGLGNSHGIVSFNPLTNRQRGALLLLNGVIYIDWASYNDFPPYHGWIMGYDEHTLKQLYVLCDSPDGTQPSAGGGIWESGAGLVASTDGSALFVSTGTGPFDLNQNGPDFGDTVLKLSPKLQILDYFTPFNQLCMDEHDFDMGSGGIVVPPTQTGAAHPNILITADKDGRIFVLNQNNLGKYTAVSNACNIQGRTDIDKVLQESPVQTINQGAFDTPAYWVGPSGTFVYFTGYTDHLKAYKLSNGKLSFAPSSETSQVFNYPGGNVAISSNGAQNGIAWLITPTLQANKHPNSNSTLYAFDATNLGVTLFHASLPSYTHFVAPIIANGEVFAAAGSTLNIFALK